MTADRKWPEAPARIWAFGNYRKYEEMYCSPTEIKQEEFEIPVHEYVRADLYEAALERSRDYPMISARLHDREKAREAEQAACSDALARVRDLEERLAKAAEALEPVGNLAMWTETADDQGFCIMSVGTIRKMRGALEAIQIRSEK